MSLLDRGGHYEPCTVYPAVTSVDVDGNTIQRPSTTGIPALGRFQPQLQSGTSSRRAEQNDEGFFTEQVYAVRFPRSFTSQYGELGSQATVEWRGDTFSVFGKPIRYPGSRNTDHVSYLLRRN